MVRVELAQGGRVVVHGRTDGLGALTGENLIINGNGAVNQRVAVSGTSLALDAYFLDRWQSATSSNAVTWTGGEQGRVITIPSAKAVKTTLEQRDVPAADYVLSWAGTATARVYNAGGTAPAYAASPVLVTLDGTANVVIEATVGTLSAVKLERGGVATLFGARPWGEELRLCQRYYTIFSASERLPGLAQGFQVTTTRARLIVTLPATMRARPSVDYDGLEWTDMSSVGTDGLDSLTLPYETTGDRTAIMVEVTWSGGDGAAFRPGMLRALTGGGWLAFTSEL